VNEINEPERADMLTVREALTVPSLADAQVIVAGARMEGPVSSVTVGEVPDVAEFLAGRELVLSTLYAFATDPEARVGFVRALAGAGAAGLMTKPDRFLGGLDDELVTAAREAGLPLISVPDDVRWTDVVREVYELALGKRAKELERIAGAQRELVRLAVEGSGYERLAETTSGLLGRPVVVQDGLGRTLAAAPRETEMELAPPGTLAKAAGEEGLLVAWPEGGAAETITAPMLVGGAVLGGVGTTVPPGLSAPDESVLTHAATVGAILIGREQVRLETELRLRGDFLAEVQSSRAHDQADVLGTAALLGADLSTGAIVLATRFDPAATAGTGVSELERSVSAFLLTQHRNTLVATRGRDLFAFLGLPRGADAERFSGRAEKVAERLGAHLRSVWPGGGHALALGRTHAADGLRDALREAEVALEVAARLGSVERALGYDEVGSYKLLVQLADRDPEELERFVAETIGPLESGSGELLHTLTAYVETDGNIAEVAASLFMHRHTVRYRLDRITKLTGLDPRTSEGREQLSLGLKAAQLLKNVR
jgi:purine catabolism regulator